MAHSATGDFVLDLAAHNAKRCAQAFTWRVRNPSAIVDAATSAHNAVQEILRYTKVANFRYVLDPGSRSMLENTIVSPAAEIAGKLSELCAVAGDRYSTVQEKACAAGEVTSLLEQWTATLEDRKREALLEQGGIG